MIKKENSTVEKTKGKDPKIAMLNQDNAVNKKACCKLSFLSWSRFDKKNNVPKTMVTIEELKKDASTSLYKSCAITGTNIKIPRII